MDDGAAVGTKNPARGPGELEVGLPTELRYRMSIGVFFFALWLFSQNNRWTRFSFGRVKHFLPFAKLYLFV